MSMGICKICLFCEK